MFLHSFLNLCTRILIILIIREFLLMIVRTVFLNKEVKRIQGKVALVYALLMTKELFDDGDIPQNIPVRGIGRYQVSLDENFLKIDEMVIDLKKDLINQLLPLIAPMFEKIELEASFGIFFKGSLIRSCMSIENVIKSLPQMIEEDKKKGDLV